MIVTQTISDCRIARTGFAKLALVPTMGAIHAGHMSLVTLAKKHAPHVAVSIFVNPTQFSPREDLSKYPRPIERDLQMCRDAGVDLVFNPSVEEMYPPRPTTVGSPHLPISDRSTAFLAAAVAAAASDMPSAELVLDLPHLSAPLEGRFRPGHFRGVCQVVAKLFNILTPDVACFGMKDYQQLRVLTAMVELLNWNIKIVAGPTLRDPDGMAMSSRNQYLDEPQRQRALAISRALMHAKRDFDGGVRQANRLVTTIQNILLDGGIQGRVPLLIDYVSAVDAHALRPVEVITHPTVLVVAARVGSTRLIDNVILTP